MRKLLLPLLMLAICCISNSQLKAQQSVGIGTTTPNTEAILDLDPSSPLGLLMPRLVLNDTNSFSTVAANDGMIFYATDINAFVYYDASTTFWTQVGSGAGGGSGTDGLTSLITATPEAPGVNCTDGGQRIDIGLDDNDDAILQPGEIDNTFYVCNGASGTDGLDGDRYATTSTTSLTIGLGAQSLTVDTALAYTAAQTVIIAESGTNFMEGTVTTYNPSTGALDVNVTSITGGGTFSSWTVNLAGAPGPAGADGNTILSGSGAPGGGTGVDGDFYIDTDIPVLYGPKAAGAWPAPGDTLVGADGANGIDGIDGNTVLNGLVDPTVGDGVDGDFYINTTTDSIFGPKSGGVWGIGTSLVGADGADGIDGNTIVSGSGAPLAGTGVDGDFYIDTDIPVLYGPKAAGAWPAPGDTLVGADGANGIDGIDGNTVLNGLVDPTVGDGVDGDFYINTTTDSIFGPKSGGVWGIGTSLVGADGADGIDGNTIVSGSGAPLAGTGVDGDFYIDTDIPVLYGPKAAGAWPAPGDTLVGADGANGIDGIDGNTVLNGLVDPTVGDGVDGDFYINTTTDSIFGPKSGGVWGIGTSLVGADGADGIDGNTIVSGSGAPLAGTGVDGDFYIDTDIPVLYGPKAAGAWPAPGDTLVGADGANGIDGIDGNTVLNGLVDPTVGDGVDGDFYINTTTDSIFGPKSGGVWGIGTSLVGADGADGIDGLDGDRYATTSTTTLTIALGPQSLTVDTALAYTAAQTVIIAESGTNFMEGTVTTYNPSTGALDVNVTSITGGGTFSSWTVNLAGAPGPAGADGNTILSGSGAPGGGTGVDGDFYIDTDIPVLYGPKAAGAWPAPGDTLVGADGANGIDGIDGNTVLNGLVDPTVGDGVDGDFYINTTTDSIFGPKSGGVWGIGTSLVGADGADGIDGNTIVSGSGAPLAGTGVDGDFYIDTDIPVLYGPKAAGAWPAPGDTLVGADGANGIDGIDGNTVLNGLVDPTVGDGVDGDFYINTTTDSIFGPKSGGVWGIGTSLVGADGADGIDGNTIVSGSGAPLAGTGVDGDFYIDTDIPVLYGPKAAGAWPAPGDTLVGADGANGIDGIDGNTVLNGLVDPTVGDGVDGDFYINTTTDSIFGPKSGGVWGIGTSLVGPQGIAGNTVLNGTVDPTPGDGIDGDFYINTASDSIFGPKAGGVWPAGEALIVAAGANDTIPANVFSAHINNTGAATLISQSYPFIQSVVRLSLGRVEVTYVPGFFTQAPSVLATTRAGGFLTAMIDDTFNDAVRVQIITRRTDNNLLEDRPFNLIVQRQGVDYQNSLTAPPNVIGYWQRNGSNIYVDTVAGVGIGTNVPSAQLETTQDIIVNGVEIGKGANNDNRSTAVGLRTFDVTNLAQANTAVGYEAGWQITNGSDNVAVGSQALTQTTTGTANTAVGGFALQTNQTGNNNTALGAFADVNGPGINNSMAIGANSQVTQNNSVVIGSINGVNGATADVNVGIGTTAPANRLEVVGDAAKFDSVIIANNAQAGYVLTAADASGAASWQPAANTGADTLGELNDVNIVGLNPSDFLRYNGTQWINTPSIFPITETYTSPGYVFDLNHTNNGGTMRLRNNSPFANDYVLNVEATNDAIAGYFVNNQGTATNQALYTHTQGTGPAFVGLGLGTASGAARFANTNAGNNQPTVTIENAGTGLGLNVVTGAVQFDYLGGGGSQLVLTDNAGLLSTAPIPASPTLQSAYDGGQTIAMTGADIDITSSGANPVLTIDDVNENVGIGTATPNANYQLDVVGGDIRVNGVRIGLGTGAIANNLAIGVNALNNNPTGSSNIAIGSTALQTNTSGILNLALGNGALIFNSTGSSNTIVGHDAMRNPAGSSQNTGMGEGVMRNGVTGNANTAIGYYSLRNKTGNLNSAIGHSSGISLNGGDNNTFVGSGADAGIANLNNATAVGANALVSQDNSLVLGNNANVGIGTSVPGERLDIIGNIQFTGALMPDSVAGNPGEVLTSAGPGFAPTWQPGASAHTLQAAYDGGQTINMGSGNIDFISSGANSVLYIDELNERVGIGNTSPANPLDVLNTTSASAINAVTNFNAARNEGINSLVSGSASENFGISGRGVGGTLSIGVNGEASNASSSNIGVRGVGFNTVNAGWIVGVQGEVQGVTTATNAYGFNAVATATGSTNNVGVNATASGATNNYGIYSTATGGTTNYAAYFEDGDVIAENGNVGIGTFSPSNRLEVVGDAAKFDSVIIVNGAQAGYILTSNASGEASWQPGASAHTLQAAYDGGQTINMGSGNIDFISSAANSVLYIDEANERVGIGNTGPVNKLDVDGGMVIGGNYAGTNTAPISGLLVEGNVGIGTTSANAPLTFNAVQANRKIVLLEGANNDHQFFGFGVGPGAILRYQVNGPSADHVFYSSVNASSSIELARITGDGNLGIGNNNPGSRLDVVDNVLTGETVGRFTNTNTGNEDGAAIIATSTATNPNFGIGIQAEGNYIGVEAIGSAGGFAGLRAQSFGAVTAIEVLSDPSSTSGIHVDANGATYSGLFENGDLSLQGNVGAGGFITQEIVNSNADGQTSLDFVNDANRMEIRYEGSNFLNNSLVIFDDDDGEARLIIDDVTGDVAIGDYSPDEKLDVTDSIAAGWVATQVENLAADGIASYDLVTDVGYYGIGTDASGVGSGLEGDFYVANYNLGSTPLVITDADNVGIGTITPSNRLEVVGDAAKFDSVIIVNGAQIGYVLTSADATGAASWQPLPGPINSWLRGGNAGTVDGVDVIGTTDAVALNFIMNSQPSGRIDDAISGYTGFGYQSGNNGGGVNNAAFGFRALASNTADGNTAVGALSLENNIGTAANTGIGYATLRNIAGVQNTAIGNAAMENSTSANDNVAVGYLALLNAISDGNTAIGNLAMSNSNNILAVNNVAIGYNTLVNTSNGQNTAVGSGALAVSSSGSGNTSVGERSMNNNLGGNENTAVGLTALFNNTSGNQNTGLGYDALFTNTTGGQNVGIGWRAGFNLDGGSNNVFIGYDADAGNANIQNSTAIGYNAVVSQDNSLVLGDTANIRVGIGTSAPATNLHIEEDFVNVRLKSRRSNTSASTLIEFGRDNGVGGFVETGSIGTPGSGDFVRLASPNAVFLNAGFSDRLTINSIGTITLSDFAGSGRRVLTVNNSGIVGSIDLSDSVNWARSGNDIYNTNSASVVIGTSTINNGKLQITTEINENSIQAWKYANVVTGAQMRLIKARGTEAIPTAVLNNDDIARYIGTANFGGGFSNAGSINMVASENWSAGSRASRMEFETVNLGTTATSVKMTLDSEGDLGIGVTNPLAKLHINSGASAVPMRLDNTVAGNTILDVYNNGTLGTRYQTTTTSTNIISQSTRDINLFTNGLNRMTVDGSNGNVGIGTSTPVNNLDVEGGVAIGATYSGTSTAPANGLIVEGSLGIGTNSPFYTSDFVGGSSGAENILGHFRTPFTVVNQGTGIRLSNTSNANGNVGHVDIFAIRSASSFGELSIRPAGVEIMRATNSSVGIGTSTPTERFEVRGDDATTDGSSGVWMRLQNGASGTGSISTGVLFNTYGIDGTDKGGIFFRRNQGFGIGDMLFSMNNTFDASTVNSSNAYVRMILTSDGDLGLGTTAPSEKLTVVGNVYSTSGDFYGAAGNGVFNVGGGILSATINTISDGLPVYNVVNGDEDLYIQDDLEVAGQAYKTGGGSWATISDQRLKKNIQPFNDGLSKLLQINPVKFQYNSISGVDEERVHVGIIAQEVEPVIPYAVKTMPLQQQMIEDENGNEQIKEQGIGDFKTFDPSSLDYLIINAVKEQQQIIDAQNQLIQDLEQRIQALENK